MKPPASTLKDWFAAHESGDLRAAAALLADDAVVRVPGDELHGFDEFIGWYATRRSQNPEFRYEVVEILGGERHAAAVIDLTDGANTWRQVALYEVADGQINAIALFEDKPEA